MHHIASDDCLEPRQSSRSGIEIGVVLDPLLVTESLIDRPLEAVERASSVFPELRVSARNVV